ncbi:uncharacterized protein LOC130748549 [Lotus japonicus]|uniref:uncharacterized protein LOC130748549 n=1 Tax=Lotus japonicus TaxID=34305 RepID=UPI002585F37B|nr:uncharacterized protein LOC130748549 [Lotus japonicus]
MAVAFPSSRTETSSLSYSSAFASSTVASFSPRASPLMSTNSTSAAVIANVRLRDHRSLPPTPPSPPSSVKLSVERRPPVSPGRRSMRNNNNAAVVSSSVKEEKRTPACMCSPTSHAGSFRCAYHKRLAEQKEQQRLQEQEQQRQHTASLRSRKLHLRRSAMKNSLVRIGCLEGAELVKRGLTNIVRSASHQIRRREAFEPRPSRLSVMSKAQ